MLFWLLEEFAAWVAQRCPHPTPGTQSNQSCLSVCKATLRYSDEWRVLLPHAMARVQHVEGVTPLMQTPVQHQPLAPAAAVAEQLQQPFACA